MSLDVRLSDDVDLRHLRGYLFNGEYIEQASQRRSAVWASAEIQKVDLHRSSSLPQNYLTFTISVAGVVPIVGM